MKDFHKEGINETQLFFVVASSKTLVVNLYSVEMLAIMNEQFPHSMHK